MKTVDHDAAHRLALWAVNDGDIYRQSIMPVVRNLARKIRKGVYDKDKALIAWGHVADDAAQSYTRELGCRGPHGSYGIFSKATRMEAARELQDDFLLPAYQYAQTRKE